MSIGWTITGWLVLRQLLIWEYGDSKEDRIKRLTIFAAFVMLIEGAYLAGYTLGSHIKAVQGR